MDMKPPPVTTYSQVNENVKSFNLGLVEEPKLERILAYLRAWYYDPAEDAVGPSKFIGYSDMTARNYLSRHDLDGKETEPVLARFFEVLKEGTPEFAYVEQKVLDLCAGFGKRISRAARFSAPDGWRVSSQRFNHSNPESKEVTNPAQSVDTSFESEAIVEVFLRAFHSLRPSEQTLLLRRINAAS